MHIHDSRGGVGGEWGLVEKSQWRAKAIVHSRELTESYKWPPGPLGTVMAAGQTGIYSIYDGMEAFSLPALTHSLAHTETPDNGNAVVWR